MRCTYLPTAGIIFEDCIILDFSVNPGWGFVAPLTESTRENDRLSSADTLLADNRGPDENDEEIASRLSRSVPTDELSL